MTSISKNIKELRKQAIKEEAEKIEFKFQKALPPPSDEKKPWEEKDEYVQLEFEELRKMDEAERNPERRNSKVESGSTGRDNRSWSSSWGSTRSSSYSYLSSTKDHFLDDVDRIARSAYGSKIEQQKTERGSRMERRGFNFKRFMKNPAVQGAMLVTAIAATKGLLWFLYRQAANRDLDFAGKI
jgi:hypothetical protein